MEVDVAGWANWEVVLRVVDGGETGIFFGLDILKELTSVFEGHFIDGSALGGSVDEFLGCTGEMLVSGHKGIDNWTYRSKTTVSDGHLFCLATRPAGVAVTGRTNDKRRVDTRVWSSILKL